MEAASKVIERHEPIFLDLCRRVLAWPLESRTDISLVGNPTTLKNAIGRGYIELV
jgi:hypothetical protein